MYALTNKINIQHTMEYFPSDANYSADSTRQSKKPFLPPSHGGRINSRMFLASYEMLERRASLKEASIHNNTLKLVVPPPPPSAERAQNPLNRPENCINGNIVAVVGLPGAADYENEWTRREFALIDYGPEAETKSVPAYQIPTQAGRLIGPKTTAGYRYALAPYNYSNINYMAPYIALSPSEPVNIGSGPSEDWASNRARHMLDLQRDLRDLRRISAEQLTIVLTEGEIILRDTSQHGTDVAYIGQGSIY